MFLSNVKFVYDAELVSQSTTTHVIQTLLGIFMSNDVFDWLPVELPPVFIVSYSNSKKKIALVNGGKTLL